MNKALVYLGIFLCTAGFTALQVTWGIRFICLFSIACGFALIIFGFAGIMQNKASLKGWRGTVPRFIRLFMIAGLCCFVISFVIIESLIIQGGKTGDINNIDCILVLGAGLRDNRPSPILSERLNTAIEVLEGNSKLKAVLCGGLGEGKNISEAEAMKRYLTEHGISQDRIFLEEHSTDTQENIEFARRLIEENGLGKRVGVITSDFHLWRSVMQCKRSGLEATGIATRTPGGAVVKANYNVREYFSIIVFFIEGSGIDIKRSWFNI
jgi:uncharacterized SAM-binding protein YcdF (DUF218 family)